MLAVSRGKVVERLARCRTPWLVDSLVGQANQNAGDQKLIEDHEIRCFVKPDNRSARMVYETGALEVTYAASYV